MLVDEILHETNCGASISLEIAFSAKRQAQRSMMNALGCRIIYFMK
jgi:hypothetical protein|tara:strand:- start:395 stop:532 length:138 start_codon:yes stop_codon:yes gene_type:complete